MNFPGKYGVSPPVRFAGWLVPALLTLAGCNEQGQPGGGGFSMPPTPVETAPVSITTVTDRFTAVGTLEASESITVTSQIDGLVESLPFKEGRSIRRGGIIARLDDDQLIAEVERAEALRDQRQVTFERIEAIVAQKAGSAQDLDDAAAALKVAQADLALARARLAKTRITAPFAGLLGARRISPGAFLRAGTEITDLVNIDELRITFSAPERILGRLAVGAAVTVSTTAYSDHELRGHIDVIEPQLDAGTRSAGIVARVENTDRLFRPGMSATVSVILSERLDAMTVPSESVFVEGGQAFVFAINPDSTVIRVGVELGTRTAVAVEIRSGLEAGQSVVRAGHQKLYPGAKVMPISADPEPTAAPSEEGR